MPILASRPKAAGLHWTLAVVIWLAVSAPTPQVAGSSSESIRVDRDDFEVHAGAVLVSDHNNDLDARLYTIESYSAAMKIGHVRVERVSGAGAGPAQPSKYSSDFYHTDELDENRFMQISEHNPTSCGLLDDAQLTRELFGDRQVKPPNLLMLLPINEGQNKRHLFGLARLLLFFDLHRAQFEPVPLASTYFFKNGHADLFKTSLSIPDTHKQIEILALVAPVGAGGARNVIGDRDLLRIEMSFPWQSLLVVDFKQVRRVQANRIRFNLPVGRGCSRWMLEGAGAERGNQPSGHPEDVLSFNYELHQMAAGARPTNNAATAASRHVQSSFVAYDGRLGLVRTEPVHLADGRPKHELTIHDLSLGVKFHVHGVRDLVERQRSFSHYDADSGQICTKTKLSKLELLPLEQIVPPADHLARMGSSEVRGVECAMFEGSSKRLPRIIFEPVTWLDRFKREQSTFDLSLVDAGANATSSEQRNYWLVYHMAAATAGGREQSGRLLRMDVYDSDSVHLYRVEVYDFQRRLMEAPNGDSRHDLFSLSQRCEPPDSAKYLADMQLELTPLSTGPGGADARDQSAVLAKLGHSANRQTELVRSVTTTSSSISGTQILDVSSRVVAGKIKASFKLLPEHVLKGPPLIQVLAIGAGEVNMGVEPSRKSFTFGECFWEAAAIGSARAGEPSAPGQQAARCIGVFSFCSAGCFIETGPRIQALADEGKGAERKSGIFSVSSEEDGAGPCQLFALKQQVSPSTGHSAPTKPIELQLDEWRLEQEHKITSLAGESFQVAGVQVEPSSRQPVEDSVSPIFEGVSLVEPDAGPDNSIRIERPPRAVHSFEHCQSECFANATCRAYSVCVEPNGQLSCLLTTFDLMKAPVRTELRSMMQRQGGRDGGQTSAIRLPVLGEERSIELRLNKRCRLVAKVARNLFKRTFSLTARQSRLQLADMHAVSDQEHCAELCLRRSAGYFRRLARLQVDMKVSPSSDGSETNLTRSLESHHAHLATLRLWCDRYKFLSLNKVSRSGELREDLAKFGSKAMREKARQRDTFGLCFVARGRWLKDDIPAGSEPEKSSERGADKKKSVVIEMETFEFRYSTLYQLQEGFRLAGVRRGQAAEAGSSQAKLSMEQTLVERPADVDLCARMCFAQSVQWCRSFDLIRESSSSFYCAFNSLSLREALKMVGGDESLVMVRQEANSTVRFEHFEPLDSYTLDIVKLEVDEDKNEQLDDDDDDEADSGEPALDGVDQAGRSSWPLLVCALGGLLSGLPLAALVVAGCDRWLRRQPGPARLSIPEVHLARLSFSLPVGESGQSSLLSQDQLEIRHRLENSETG